MSNLKLTSRGRIRMAINHIEPDQVPVDIGACVTTGIHAIALARLREALHLENKLIRVFEPMMFLGEVDSELIDLLGGDVIGVHSPATLLGYKNERWKKWRMPTGLEVLVGDGFNVTYDKDGTVYAYPKGDLNGQPSAKMPNDGLYFDNMIRQEDLSEHVFDARVDYADQFSIIDDELCSYYQKTVNDLYDNTDYSLFSNSFFGSIGDIFHIPAAWLKEPKGIRDLEEWIMAPYLHPQYVHDFFALHTEFAIKNLELYHQAVGDKIDVIAVSGTDFGTQTGLFISPDCYLEFYQPYHKIINNWIHAHTKWKVFFHSCGYISGLLDDFIEAGVDIINPVQTNREGMDPKYLKDTYGDRIVFWGGGVNPQTTMLFGSPEDVARERKTNIEIFSKNGGYVFSHIHNIQANTPPENIIQFFNVKNNL